MKRWFKQIMIVFLFTMISSFGRTQYSPFGYYGLRLGCGNDLDLTFTGTVLMVAGGVTYIYGSQLYPVMYNQTQPPTQLQIYNIQRIGVTLVITGVAVLIEESIRHGLHKRR
jgi:hypothetical protein